MPDGDAAPFSGPMDDHQHVHDHSGKTSCDDGHAHLHLGVTGPPRPSRDGHTHLLRGLTTFDDGHTHAYSAESGPAIGLPGGFHTHYFSLATNLVDGHRHRAMGYLGASRD